MRRLFLIVAVLLAGLLSYAGQRGTVGPMKVPVISDLDSCRQVVYKEVDGVALKLYFVYPSNFTKERKYPAVVFFFGGGWTKRNITQFLPHSYELAKRGLISVVADYRVESLHKVSPVECVCDARDAMRYIRGHHEELSVDTGRIAAAGGSAGGHLAAATATITAYDSPGDSDPTPDALVLFNPVIDNGPEGGYAYGRVKAYYEKISPAHNIRKGVPPTLFMVGTHDKLVPVTTALRYQRAMLEAGNRCDLYLYGSQEHSFFNYKDGYNPYYYTTLSAMIAFLEQLEFMD